ncbi:MAG: radical SAM protein [bacterium]|nr:radical SAM protein [bacterium]
MENKLKIIESFSSVQGEGIHSGLPTYFVRLSGCNLRCYYCDTKYSYSGGEEKKIKDILNDIARQKFKLVCLTGGEPLLQPGTKILINKLVDLGYNIDIETNGSILINEFNNSSKILYSLDVKCPSSGMSEKMKLDNLKYLAKKDQVKFIIGNRNDYIFSKKIVERYKLIKKTNIIFTPVDGIKAKKLVEWILIDGFEVRIGLQIHKVIWKSEREELNICKD